MRATLLADRLATGQPATPALADAMIADALRRTAPAHQALWQGSSMPRHATQPVHYRISTPPSSATLNRGSRPQRQLAFDWEWGEPTTSVPSPQSRTFAWKRRGPASAAGDATVACASNGRLRERRILGAC